MITAALNGDLKDAKYQEHDIFGLQIPLECPNVPSEILNPINTWKDKNKYEETAIKLAQSFSKNFELYKNVANEEIINGGPKITSIERKTHTSSI